MLLCGLLKLKAASGMVFATCWNYHLHIAHTGMVFAVKFHELHGAYHILKPKPVNCAKPAAV